MLLFERLLAAVGIKYRRRRKVLIAIMAIIPRTSTTRVGAIITATTRPGSSRSLSADCAIRNRLLFKLGIDHPRTTQGKKKMMMKGGESSRRVSYPSSTSSSSTASCSDSDDQDSQEDDIVVRQHTTRRRQVSSSSTDSSSHYTVPLKFKQDPQDLPLGQDNDDDSPSTLSEPPLCITTNCILANKKKTPKKSIKKSLYKSCIQFNPQVTVIPIPSHKTYPPEIHNALYLSRTEMSVNTIRNTREFIYEGWNWTNVIEEDGMYRSKVTKGPWVAGVLVHPAHVGGANVVSSKGNARGGGSRRRNPYL